MADTYIVVLDGSMRTLLYMCAHAACMCADVAEQVQARVLLAQAVKELKGYRYSISSVVLLVQKCKY